MRRAIVLGGGGVTGIGWEVGIVAGLGREGVDLAAADVVIGTSAGAFVGAILAGLGPDRDRGANPGPGANRGPGASRGPGAGANPGPSAHPGPGATLDEVAARVSGDATAPEIPAVDFGLVAQAFAVMSDRSLDAATARARVGALARSAEVGDPALFVRWFADHLPVPDAWPPSLRVTAVDAVSGEPVVWDAASGVDLVTAVAASCAVPCVFPPVPANGSLFMDGGVRSVTNADLAAGASAVVVVAPVVGVFGGTPTAELAALGDARHALIAPDDASRAAMGDNVFDDRRRPLAVAAGIAQGAALAASVVRPVWDVGRSG